VACLLADFEERPECRDEAATPDRRCPEWADQGHKASEDAAVGLRPHGTSVVLDHLHGRKVLGWARFGGQDDDSDVLA
jgi:hypothetical protein